MHSAINNTKISPFTPDQHEALFGEIVRLYDLADNIAAAVELEGQVNRGVQSELARPLVTQITNSATVLTAFYTEIARNGRPITPELQNTFEEAFRNMVFAFEAFIEGVETRLLPQGGKS